MHEYFEAHDIALLKGLSVLPQVVVSSSLAGQAAALLRPCMKLRNVAVVCDGPTHEALGARIVQELASSCSVKEIILYGTPRADSVTAQKLMNTAEDTDGFIAVGGGTINDLCKYASYQLGKPYAVFPTAPSMNGYTSANASIITHGGLKHSLPAHLPMGVFCDMEVLAKAPLRLRRAGFGDCLARSTAQTDWLLSHLLLDTPYEPRAFELLAPYEAELFKNARAIAQGDMHAVALLMKVLLLSGLGMTLCGGSYPASQSEHMIAHCYELLCPTPPDTLHGEEIGVTTLIAAKLQEKLLASDSPRLREWRGVSPPLLGGMSAAARDAVEAGWREKRALMESETRVQERLNRRWPDTRRMLQESFIPPAKLTNALRMLGAPLDAQQLGWNSATLENACKLARFTRARFTCLDLE